MNLPVVVGSVMLGAAAIALPLGADLMAQTTTVQASTAAQFAAGPSAADEAVYKRYLDFDTLVRGGRVTPNWLPDGSTFWYAQGEPNDRRIVKLDPATNSETSLFDAGRLRAALRDWLDSEPAGTGVPFERFHFVGPNRVSFSLDGAAYQLDLDNYSLSRQLPALAFSTSLVISEAERAIPGTFMRERLMGVGPVPSPEAMSPDGRWFAGIDNDNLTLRATVDGRKVQITQDGTPLAFWDVEGMLWSPWSPDGQNLAVFKVHTEGLPRIPSIHWLKPLEQVQEVVTVPAGNKLYRTELHLVNMNSPQPVAVDLGDITDQYIRPLNWLPDGSELILARYNRTFSRVDIQAVNASTRAVRTVMTEQSKTFLTNHHEAIWGGGTSNAGAGFALLPDGSGFVWNSERSGWDHLYLYDLKGKLVRQLTSGDWRVKDVVRIDQTGGWIYFTGHGDKSRPYDTHLYRVGLDGKGLSQLTEGKGQHTVNISPSAQYFTDTYSAVDVPSKTVLRKADGTLIRTLGEADISRLQAAGWVAPKEYVVKAADGTTDLWATMYFPYNFDPAKKYPVVEYIYAGPQIAMRPMDFGDIPFPYRGAHFNRALANLGFVVVTLDARGTPERSKAFQDVVYMNWGQFEIADHAGALRQLGERLPFMDLDRVGIHGGSWGGQFTFRALTQAPDLYKVGISQVPGFDSRRFTLYETYLGMPQEHKAAYDAADVFPLAPQLKGELLLIGGLNDIATQGDLFRMSETLIRLGKQHETMSYPNSGHGAMGVTGEYDMELKKRFFVKHLLKPTND